MGIQTHLVGETTSKQKRRSMSSQCLTVHNLRSSTTTVGLSWGINTRAEHNCKEISQNVKTKPIFLQSTFPIPVTPEMTKIPNLDVEKS